MLYKKELAEFLLKQCEQRGLSLRTLSINSGLSPATVHNIINRKYQPTLFSLNRLADYLGVKREYLWQLAGLLEDMDYDAGTEFGDPQLRFQFSQIDKLPQAPRKLIIDMLKSATAYFLSRGVQPEPIPFVSYSITTKCNLRCKHCYSKAGEAAPDELSTREAFQLIDDLSEWGVGLLVIDGGEPLCRQDVLAVVKYASSKGIRTGIGSNGTLIDKAMVTKMLDAGVKSVAISVDGAVSQTHDSFRGSGTFNQALKGAEACRNAGLPFRLNMVIRKDTLSQLEDMLCLAVDYGANAAGFFDLFATGRAKQQCSEQLLTPDERKQAMELLAEAQRDCPIVIAVRGCPMYPLLLQENDVQSRHFPRQMLQKVSYYGRGCAAGRGYLSIRANGDVNPCVFLPMKLGNIREQPIISIWQDSPILAQLRQRELLKGDCGDCAYKVTCSGCRGRAYEETGDMMAADPGCWLAPECL